MVRIQMIDNRPFKYFVNALREMTPPLGTNKYKEVVLSNDIAFLGIVDMYEGIS